MKMRIDFALILAAALTFFGAALMVAQTVRPGTKAVLPRPKGPCDIYAAAGDPCVAAHSTTRALFAGL